MTVKDATTKIVTRYHVLDPIILTYAVLLIAKVWLDKNISWWAVFAPLWIPLLGMAVFAGFMLLVNKTAKKMVEQEPTQDEQPQEIIA